MARADAAPDQRPCPLLRGTCQDSQELPPIKDGHAAVSADRQEGRVSGNEVVDAARRRAAQKVVVVWITAHPRARLVGEKHGLGAKQLQERLPVGRRDRVLLRDLGSAQDLGHLFGLGRHEEEHERSTTPLVHDLSLNPPAGQQAADQLVGVQEHPKHDDGGAPGSALRVRPAGPPYR